MKFQQQIVTYFDKYSKTISAQKVNATIPKGFKINIFEEQIN